MSRAVSSEPEFPDCDDTLRRLANVLQIPLTCRRQRCRRGGQCEGGYGPPCYFENHRDFVAGVREQMPEYRDYWSTKRQEMQEGL
ncbi:hypothetical protein AB4Y85_02475 [Microvirga sp. 2YAF29]|uniref:hypothetical protein n=1 Tax=Microvirga sp. 2YAF29 TaxID=3233031 RepID=UPI003F989091